MAGGSIPDSVTRGWRAPGKHRAGIRDGVPSLDGLRSVAGRMGEGICHRSAASNGRRRAQCWDSAALCDLSHRASCILPGSREVRLPSRRRPAPIHRVPQPAARRVVRCLLLCFALVMQKSDSANQIEPTADSLLEKCQRRTIPRWRLVLVGILVGIGLLAFAAMRASALPGKFPSGFFDAEKREILARAHTDAL